MEAALWHDPSSAARELQALWSDACSETVVVCFSLIELRWLRGGFFASAGARGCGVISGMLLKEVLLPLQVASAPSSTANFAGAWNTPSVLDAHTGRNQNHDAHLLLIGAVLLLQEGLCWGHLLLLHALYALPLCCLLRT
jgi:hypothetical protein